MTCLNASAKLQNFSSVTRLQILTSAQRGPNYAPPPSLNPQYDKFSLIRIPNGGKSIGKGNIPLTRIPNDCVKNVFLGGISLHPKSDLSSNEVSICAEIFGNNSGKLRIGMLLTGA